MRSSRFSLVDFAVVVGVAVLFGVLLLPATLRARTVSRQAACADHFKNIGLALHNYHSVHTVFPPGRVWESNPQRATHGNGVNLQVLPYIEQSAVYNTFNFSIGSWTAIQNETTRIQKIEVFLCPDDQMESITTSVDPIGQPTNVAYSLGSLTWITHPAHAAANKSPKPEGVFFDNSAIGLREIPDGSSMTVLASEQRIDVARRDGSAEFTGECSGAIAQGVQYFERTGSRWPAGNPSSNYFNARRPPNDSEVDCFHGMPTDIGSLNKVPRSRHDGGVNVVLGDGSVRFVRNAIELNIWQAVNTRSGSERVASNQF